MEQKSPNWIAERAKCEPQHLFASLRELVRQNTEWANKLSESPGSQAYEYHEEIGDICVITKMRPAESTDQVTRTFRLSSTQRAVHVSGRSAIQNTPNYRLYTLTTRWDAEKSKCHVVMIHDETMEEVIFPHKHLWKAVQYILEPFFFTPQE